MKSATRLAIVFVLLEVLSSRAHAAEQMIRACWTNATNRPIYHSIRFASGGRYDFVLAPRGRHDARIPLLSWECRSYEPIGNECPSRTRIRAAPFRGC